MHQGSSLQAGQVAVGAVSNMCCFIRSFQAVQLHLLVVSWHYLAHAVQLTAVWHGTQGELPTATRTW
jgi:hypothetical protein